MPSTSSFPCLCRGGLLADNHRRHAHPWEHAPDSVREDISAHIRVLPNMPAGPSSGLHHYANKRALSADQPHCRAPEECPLGIANLVEACWEPEPDDRPTAMEVVEAILKEHAPSQEP